MADIAETVIAALAVKIQAAGGGTIPFLYGKKKLHEHAIPPRVVWVPKPSKYDPAKRVGGSPQAEIGVDRAAFDVHVWHTSLENARTTCHNIIAAARQCYPGALLFLGYDPAAGFTHEPVTQGEEFVMDVTLLIKVDEFIAPTVDVDGFEGDALMRFPSGDEVYASLDMPRPVAPGP